MAYDANFSSVVLLLHGDGANGSTTFTDSSPSPKVPSSVGGSKIDTGFTPFTTGGSIKLPLSTPLVYAGQVAFNVNITSWTIEMWAYELSTSQGSLVSRRATSTATGWVFVTYGIRALINGAGFETQMTWTRPSFNTWHHYAWVKDGTNLRVYVDGALVSTKTGVTSLSDGGGNVNFGQGDQAGEYRFDGYVDEVRWTSGVARYTADFTPLTAPFPSADHETASSSLVGPAPTVSSYSGAISVLSSPPPMFYAGVIPSASVAITAPTQTLSAASGASSFITAPGQTLAAAAHSSYGEQAAFLTSPSPLLIITTGADAHATSSGPMLSASGTVTIWVKADLTAPVSTLAATGTVSGTAKVGLSAPSPNLVGYSGAVCSITLTGSPTLTSTGTTGGVGGAQATCPLFQLSAGATAQNRGGANLLSPSPRLGAQAQAWLMPPTAQLTAIGTAVVTATYEAYAVNLKHTPRPGQEPIDEATHYTNFPFTHVVRYQNSYYGANSTGLYLLEGTTDNGATIPWVWETAITDFKSPNKKTLAAAYFSGRFGTSSTIQLKKGEKSPITHAFTTPRGTLAQNHRQVFGKDRAETRTRYFALAASGTSEFELDSIECDVHNTTRRI